jgi:hypothetical protein
VLYHETRETERLLSKLNAISLHCISDRSDLESVRSYWVTDRYLRIMCTTVHIPVQEVFTNFDVSAYEKDTSNCCTTKNEFELVNP